MKKTIIFLFTAILFLIPSGAYATNLSISNVTVTKISGGTADVTFDIDWDVSWRDSTNYDAVWIFLKYSTDSGATWEHGTLYSSGTTPSGYSTGSGTGVEIEVASDQMGAFVQRSSTGSGSTSVDDVTLRWYYGADSVSGTQTVEMSVYGIEMVYVPQGSFWLGDADGDQTGCFRRQDDTTLPVNVDATMSYVLICANTSNDDTTLESTGICIDGDGGLYEANGSTLINADYPTGYKAFYCMKYEISQGQYRDFLNKLTAAEQAIVTDALSSLEYMNNSTTLSNRNGVMCVDGSASPRVYVCNFDEDTNYNEENDGAELACNYVSWADLTAYADWSGLRPMTELEFEKACRGTASAVDDEYVWGSTTINDCTNVLNDGYPDAITNTSSQNCNYNNDYYFGPVRCGIFAAGASTREEAGASYYGIMEMGGNVYERPVTLGNSTGRNFTGEHGNGELSSGYADVTMWPGSAATGSGLRGGSWLYGSYLARVSDRASAASTLSYRYGHGGGRLVRSAE